MVNISRGRSTPSTSARDPTGCLHDLRGSLVRGRGAREDSEGRTFAAAHDLAVLAQGHVDCGDLDDAVLCRVEAGRLDVDHDGIRRLFRSEALGWAKVFRESGIRLD
jgi:hypothetical protein